MEQKTTEVMTFEEVAERLDGPRSVTIGRAHGKDCARMAVRLKSEAGLEIRLLEYDGQSLVVLDKAPALRVNLDAYWGSFVNNFYPVLIGPNELRRQVELYHGELNGACEWLSKRLPHKLPNHPAIPSKASLAVMQDLMERIHRFGDAIGPIDCEAALEVSVNHMIRMAFFYRLLSEVILKSVGAPQVDLLYRKFLRHPELDIEDLSGYLMDDLVAAHLSGRITPSEAEQKAAMWVFSGV